MGRCELRPVSVSAGCMCGSVERWSVLGNGRVRKFAVHGVPCRHVLQHASPACPLKVAVHGQPGVAQRANVRPSCGGPCLSLCPNCIIGRCTGAPWHATVGPLHMRGPFAISCFVWHSWPMGTVPSSWGCPGSCRAKAPACGMRVIPHVDVHAHVPEV